MTQVTDPHPLTISICKGSALLSETELLLREWQQGEPLAAFTDRIITTGVLGKASAYRTKDMVNRLFAPRFLSPESTAVAIKQMLAAIGQGPWFRDVCLIHAARADATLRAAIVEWLNEQREGGALIVSRQGLEDWLHEQQQAGRTFKPWSDSTHTKVARGLLKAMADFGLLEPDGVSKWRFATPHLSSTAAAYLIFDSHFAGATDFNVFNAPEWQYWSCTHQARRDLFDMMSEHELFVHQIGGDVVSIAWRHDTMQEAIDAIARSLV